MSEAPQRTPQPQNQDDQPTLSIVRADRDDSNRVRRERLSSAMRLGEFYDAYVLPICREAKGSDSKTILADRTALKYWGEFTRDPSLEEIDEYDCADFVASHLQVLVRRGKRDVPISPNTVRKHCTHLQFIMDRAGPRSRRMRNAARLIPQPPGFERPPERTNAHPEILSLQEIGRWLWACDYAAAPAKMARVIPSRWWRGLVTFTYNTALRIDTVMQLEWSMLGEDGWLKIPPEIFKGGEHGGLFYVNESAREAIDVLRISRQPRIFPWSNWPTSSSHLHKWRRRLWARVGISRPGNGFHGLRRSVLTWISARNDLVARFVAGHAAGKDILQKHYVDHRQVVTELLEQVPQPKWDPGENPDQLRLPGF